MKIKLCPRCKGKGCELCNNQGAMPTARRTHRIKRQNISVTEEVVVIKVQLPKEEE